MAQRKFVRTLNWTAGGLIASPAPTNDFILDTDLPSIPTTLLTGLIQSSNLPPLAISEVNVVASQAAMLALTAQRGDVAIRTDVSKTYVLSTDSPTTLADWKEILATGTTGTIPVSLGGTGFAGGYSVGDMLYAVGAAAFSKLNIGGVGSFLGVNGAGTAPVWQSLGATDIKFAGTDKLIGRDASGAGSGIEIAVTGGLEFSGSDSIRIADAGVTNAKLANVATATIKGRSTAGTGVPEDLTSAQATALLDSFGVAGGSHQKGLVPDPGATAHPNGRYYLRDDGTWDKMPGQLLGVSRVDTVQATTSTSFTDLATIESVTFTLDSSADILVRWRGSTFNSTGGITANLAIANFDGVDEGGSESTIYPNGLQYDSVIFISKNLAAGTHTIKIRKRVTAGSGSWMNRQLSVERVN